MPRYVETLIPVLKSIVALASLAAASAALALEIEGDPVAGEKKAYTCTGCHGIPGYKNAFPNYHVPRLGGQNYLYLVSSLQAYRAGTRAHTTMNAQSGTLTDEDIHDIAAYFVTLGPKGIAIDADGSAGEGEAQ